MKYPMSMNDVHAPAKVRCQSCGAKNPPDAQWCGQCLKRFQAPPPPPAVPPVASGQPEGPASVKPGVERGAFRSTDDGILWRCTSCDHENRLEEPACAVCGTLFAEAVRPPEAERRQRDAGTTALISLFFPGAGHAYLGLWPQAIARAIVSAWVLLMAGVFAIGVGVMSIALVYGVAAFALWGVAAHDAFHEANGEPKRVLLQGRRFTYLVLGLLSVLLASIFLLSFAGR